MGESNASWGLLVSDAQRDEWDSFDSVPDAGTNVPLDNFLAKKNLDHNALTRVGARLASPAVLAFAFDGGIKKRNFITDARWNTFGAEFNALKIVPGKDRDTIILCEGETDGARLTMLYDCDVGMLPVGAKTWKDSYTEQVSHYPRLLVGLDNDEAGDLGFHRIKAALPHAVRFAPPGVNDWCKLEPGADVPPLPDVEQRALPVLVSARELLTLDVPERPSWFQDAILPIHGGAMIHSTFKSYKTWIALDMASALAQGGPFAGFENTGGQARVAYLNFEIPWAYYRFRVELFAQNARERKLFEENFMSYEPLSRPKLTAGDTKSEDRVIDNLLAAKIDVVFIDPVRRAMGFANLNAEDEVRRMLHFAERCHDHKMSTVLIHHDNKEADARGGGDPAGMTGSGAWAGDVDSLLSIQRPAKIERGDPRRNLHLLMRNAPSVPSKGFELTDKASVIWHDEVWLNEKHDPDAEPEEAPPSF